MGARGRGKWGKRGNDENIWDVTNEVLVEAAFAYPFRLPAIPACNNIGCIVRDLLHDVRYSNHTVDGEGVTGGTVSLRFKRIGSGRIGLGSFCADWIGSYRIGWRANQLIWSICIINK